MEIWSYYGFDRQPETRVSDGTAIVYRAWGGLSKKYSNYVIVPRSPAVLPINMSAPELEKELNIALFGNSIEHISEFRIFPSIRYYVGPIRQSGMIGPEEWLSFFRENRHFDQGVIPGDVKFSVDVLNDYPVRRGRFYAKSLAIH